MSDVVCRSLQYTNRLNYGVSHDLDDLALLRAPTWKNINTLLVGAILCRGARRITSILRIMGLSEIKNFSKFHRVLSRARWDNLAASKILFGLLIKLLPSGWPKQTSLSI